MILSDSSTRRLSSLILVIVMGILAFFVLEPILYAIIGGLLLAYIFYPVYTRVLRAVRSRSFAAAIIILISVALILIPLWFAIPIVFKQLFQMYIASQNIDVSGIIHAIIPSASIDFVSQATISINAAISRAASSLLNGLAVDYTKINTIFSFMLDLAVVGIVFFFSLRDSEELRKFVDFISPFTKEREKILVKQFKDITNSILYGQIVVGIIQGLSAGLGLFVFGIPNAIALTVLAIILCILPFIGTPLLWIPATIYLFSTGNSGAAIAYLIYNLVIVSTIDNVIRSYIVSRNAKVSQAVVLVGMLGGLAIFGILGIVLGPLILAYFITFINIYVSEGKPKERDS